MNMDMTPNPEGARGDRQVNPPSAQPAGERPMADREVPLRADGAMAALNAWLDGEAPAPRLANNQLTPEAQLWTQISREASARRDVRTPPHVAAQIMNALPTSRLVSAPAIHGEQTLVARAAAVPAEDKGITLHPAVLALMAAAFLALGAAIAKLL